MDLSKPTRVVAVVTQGRHGPLYSPQWVTGYKISYGNSTRSFRVIQDGNGSDLVSLSSFIK